MCKGIVDRSGRKGCELKNPDIIQAKAFVTFHQLTNILFNLHIRTEFFGKKRKALISSNGMWK
jgi:hypothetical protein